MLKTFFIRDDSIIIDIDGDGAGNIKNFILKL